MMHVMASIVVRPEHAVAARALLADVDAHMKTAHVAAAIATAGPMLAAAPEIVTFTRVDAA